MIVELNGELQSLRAEKIEKKNLKIDDSELRVEGVKGNTIELKLTISSDHSEEYGIKVCSSPNGKEETIISYLPSENKIKVDLSKTSQDPDLMSGFYEANGLIQEAELYLSESESLDLQIFILKCI